MFGNVGEKREMFGLQKWSRRKGTETTGMNTGTNKCICSEQMSWKRIRLLKPFIRSWKMDTNWTKIEAEWGWKDYSTYFQHACIGFAEVQMFLLDRIKLNSIVKQTIRRIGFCSAEPFPDQNSHLHIEMNHSNSIRVMLEKNCAQSKQIWRSLNGTNGVKVQAISYSEPAPFDLPKYCQCELNAVIQFICLMYSI